MTLRETILRLLHLLRPPRRLRFTPEGTRFVIVALAIGVAAINTGNNLLYLILAMMLSMIILSGILSESSLRTVEIKRAFPREVFAGKPFLVNITAANGKRRLPSISLTFQDSIHEAGLSGAGVNPPGLKGFMRFLPFSRGGGEGLGGGLSGQGVYFLKIPAMGRVSGSYRLSLERRGVHAFKGRLLTRYPFGLFLKSREIREEPEIIVYPRILEVKEFLKESGVDQGEVESRIKGRGTDLYGLRGYVFGDDLRVIHWKASAKLSRLYVREFAREDVRRVTLFLDDCIPAGFEESLEKGVAIAASLASHFLHRGYQVGLVTSAEDVPLGIGMEHLFRILRVLALVSPGKDRGRLLTTPVEGGGVLILPYDSGAWGEREGLFSKVIRVMAS